MQRNGSLISRRRKILSVPYKMIMKQLRKVFELADRSKNRNGGYTTMLKLSERKGDDALMVILKLVDEKAEPAKNEVKTAKTSKKVKNEEETK